MTSFAENPNLGFDIVVTSRGDKEYRQNRKYILDRESGESKYYKMGRDVFNLNGKWYRKNSGYIAYNYTKKAWVLKTETPLVKGVVRFQDGMPIIGYFEECPYNTVDLAMPGGINVPCIDENIIDKNTHFEATINGRFYAYDSVGGKGSGDYKMLMRIDKDHNYKNKGYNIEDNGQEFHNKINLYNAYPMDISRECKRFGRFLGDITFGAEIELSQGFIPKNIENRHGIVMCRDGSIAGGEAVTVPMSGAKGLQNLIYIAEDFQRRAEVDIKCSYHLHIGNIPQDRTFLCALYMLSQQIQDEVFCMFPYYKTNPDGVKQKNYCQKLGRIGIYPIQDTSKEGYKSYIDFVYERIFYFLSDGTEASAFNNKKQMKHPIPNKWDRPSRYMWLNLQNMLFSERHTAEFRIHQATLNPQKMTLWLFICNAVLKFTQLNQGDIILGRKRFTFVEILNYYANQFSGFTDAELLSKQLVGYYNARCKTFAEDFAAGDKLSAAEAQVDKKFLFESRLF